MNEAPDRTIILGLQHWVTRPDLETIFETKMVSKWSRDHFETRMSHYLEWRDWFRDHIRDQNSLNSGLETSIDTKMSHSAYSVFLNHYFFAPLELCTCSSPNKKWGNSLMTDCARGSWLLNEVNLKLGIEKQQLKLFAKKIAFKRGGKYLTSEVHIFIKKKDIQAMKNITYNYIKILYHQLN